MPAQPARRPYRSPRRREQAVKTRSDIVRAATRLFVGNGYAATSISAIADSAGVAPETVYAAFGNKRALLVEAVNVAIAGDMEPVAVIGRPDFQRLSEGTIAERLAIAAKITTDISARAADIDQVLREAAASDPELARLVAERERERRDVVGQGMAMVLGRPLNPTELDGAWAVASDQIYLMLRKQRGWSRRRYESWIADTFDRLTRPAESGHDHTR